MAVKWSDDTRGWVVLAYSDPYTAAEFSRAMETVLARRGTAGPLRLLVDRREATAPTTDFVQRIISFIAAHAAGFDGARVAIVVASDLAFGMGRMTQIRAEGTTPAVDVEVYRDLALAEAWLGEDSRHGPA